MHCRAKELETWFYLVIELSQFYYLYVLEATFWRTQYAEYGKTQQHFTCVKTNLRCNMYSKKGNNCTHAILWRQIKNLYTLMYMAMSDKYPIHTSITCLVELCVTEWNQKQKTNAFPWVLTRRIFLNNQRASQINNHFIYSHDLNAWASSDAGRQNKMLVTLAV